MLVQLHVLANSADPLCSKPGGTHIYTHTRAHADVLSVILPESFEGLRAGLWAWHADEAQFIVDPSFAQQFDIKISTPEFKHLMRLLPPVLVLPKERVEAVVELLASAMTACFRRANIDMPPWRRADAMLSKWVPRRSLDRRQRTPPSSPRAAALPPLASPLAGAGPLLRRLPCECQVAHINRDEAVWVNRVCLVTWCGS